MIKHITENDIPSIFYYIPNFITKDEQNTIIEHLEKTTDFRTSPAHGANVSRYQKWYHEDKKYFCPLWENRYPQWESFEIDTFVADMILRIKTFIKDIPNIDIPKINSCLINKYENGNHHIAPHRDCPKSFGEKPTIIGLSLGDTRTITFENDKDKINFDLESGSVLIMAGSSQKDYLHSIKKNNSKNVRYSLTFREFIL